MRADYASTQQQAINILWTISNYTVWQQWHMHEQLNQRSYMNSHTINYLVVSDHRRRYERIETEESKIPV